MIIALTSYLQMKKIKACVRVMLKLLKNYTGNTNHWFNAISLEVQQVPHSVCVSDSS